MTKHTGADRKHGKILIRLEQDSEGWPPFSVESVWARDVGNDLYQVDSVPFFARGIAFGDIVSAEQSDDGLMFREVVRASGHSTLRIAFSDMTARDETCAALVDMGCAWEGSHLESLISVDVPPSVRLELVKRLLSEGERAGKWEYEEGCLRAK